VSIEDLIEKIMIKDKLLIREREGRKYD